MLFKILFIKKHQNKKSYKLNDFRLLLTNLSKRIKVK